MKKITMFVVSLFLVMGVVAQIDTNQEYRLKNVETGLYLNAANYDEHSSGTHGGVSVAEKAESDAQIFSFEQSGNGYYLQTRSGYYIFCQSWNVDALQSPKRSVLSFADAGNGDYYILNGSKYFKVEFVSAGSGYYPFCDASLSNAAKWTLEPIVTGPVAYTVKVLGTDDASAAVVFDGQEYKADATFETTKVVKKADFQAVEVDGMFAVVYVDGTTVYVS